MWCRRGFHTFRPLLHCHKDKFCCYQNGVTMQKERQKMWLSTHYNVFLENSYKTHQAFLALHWPWPVACAWPQSSACWYGIHSRLTKPLHNCTCGSASQLMRSAIRSTCKSFHVPPFMLLIVPYNSIYYNYYTMVGWLWGQDKKGVCVGKKKKKVHSGPVSCDYKCWVPEQLYCI